MTKDDTTGAAVQISSIPRPRFERLLPSNRFLEAVIGDEVEWFADGSENLLGTVAEGLLFDPWTCVLLGSGGIAGFRVLGIKFGLPSRDEAVVQLLRAMRAKAILRVD
jgi:hypothetical protein